MKCLWVLAYLCIFFYNSSAHSMQPNNANVGFDPLLVGLHNVNPRAENNPAQNEPNLNNNLNLLPVNQQLYNPFASLTIEDVSNHQSLSGYINDLEEFIFMDRLLVLIQQNHILLQLHDQLRRSFSILNQYLIQNDTFTNQSEYQNLLSTLGQAEALKDKILLRM